MSGTPVAQWRVMNKLTVIGVLLASSVAACGGQVGAGSGTADGGKHSAEAGAHDASAADGRSSRDSGEDAKRTTKVPVNHRPDDSECMEPAAPGACDETGVPTSCTADSQCTATDGGETDGRCIPDGPIAGCHCTYDTCSGDTDCPTGQLCVCHGSPYTSGEGNTCRAGNCRVDSDCGPQGYCSPSPSGGCGSVGGYYCHTAADTCANDSDCGELGEDTCIWSSTDGRWECQMAELCG